MSIKYILLLERTAVYFRSHIIYKLKDKYSYIWILDISYFVISEY